MHCKPPPLMTSELGSFARHTIEHRKPAIIADVLADSDSPELIQEPLGELLAEIREGQVAVPPEGIPLRPEWLRAWAPWEGHTWLQLPWYFAEAYFYVRLLAAVGYFEGVHPDPFAKRKAALLRQCDVLLPSLARAEEACQGLPQEEAFALLARRSLWGNRLDLSNLAVARRHQDEPSHLDETGLVVDELAAALAAVRTAGEGRVTFLCDNCGPELLADLHLAVWLLRHGVETVVLELKSQPFFVSDAMLADALALISYLQASGNDFAASLGQELKLALEQGRLVLLEHPFWTGPGHYTELPPDLRARLADCALVISKGDVNYRRFLEDRRWPYETPLAQIISYFPAPLLLLRTFKGELAAGLPAGAAQSLATLDPNWLISGRFGVAQFVPAPGGG